MAALCDILGRLLLTSAFSTYIVDDVTRYHISLILTLVLMKPYLATEPYLSATENTLNSICKTQIVMIYFITIVLSQNSLDGINDKTLAYKIIDYVLIALCLLILLVAMKVCRDELRPLESRRWQRNYRRSP